MNPFSNFFGRKKQSNQADAENQENDSAGAQTAEANANAGIAAAQQINAYFKDGCTKFQVNK